MTSASRSSHSSSQTVPHCSSWRISTRPRLTPPSPEPPARRTTQAKEETCPWLQRTLATWTVTPSTPLNILKLGVGYQRYRDSLFSYHPEILPNSPWILYTTLTSHVCLGVSNHRNSNICSIACSGWQQQQRQEQQQQNITASHYWPVVGFLWWPVDPTLKGRPRRKTLPCQGTSWTMKVVYPSVLENSLSLSFTIEILL